MATLGGTCIVHFCHCYSTSIPLSKPPMWHTMTVNKALICYAPAHTSKRETYKAHQTYVTYDIEAR